MIMTEILIDLSCDSCLYADLFMLFLVYVIMFGNINS